MPELPAFVCEVPDYEVIDGRMHIRIGNMGLVMPVHICAKSVARCSRALDIWYESQGENIVPIAGRK
jgi:hypothetical protein